MEKANNDLVYSPKEAKIGGVGSYEAPTIIGAVSSTTTSSRNSGAVMRQEQD
jgi:hypothetical protein